MTKQELGYWGEQSAIVALRAAHLPVIHERWRHKRLEVDIIAGNSHELRFIEVKTRTHFSDLPLSNWFSEKKSLFLRQAAIQFTLTHSQFSTATLHFDFICVRYTGQSFISTYYPDLL